MAIFHQLRRVVYGLPKIQDSGKSNPRTGRIASICLDVSVYLSEVHGCNIQPMHRLDYWRPFLTLAVALIVAGVLRSAWATRLDGFTVDEPWHVTAGVAYLRTGEYYLNPEHPPLVKPVAALAAPPTVFRFTERSSLHDKTEERRFVENTMYEHNDADKIQGRVRPVMYVFNGLLLLLFAAAAFSSFRRGSCARRSFVCGG
jgi:hypothetical protein